MSLLARLERRLEEAVEGFFSRRFSGHVHPLDLARRLARAAEEGRFDAIHHTYAPNRYAVALHPRDFAPMAAWRDVLVQELTTYLREHLEEAGYRLAGPLAITVEARDEVTPGQILVQTRVEQAAGGAPAAGAVSPTEGRPAPDVRGASPGPPEREETQVFTVARPQARLAVVAGPDAGMAVLLLPGVAVTIGRRAECDLVLTDPLVSRQHARVEPAPDRRGHLLVDLGSTNGTLVGGERITRHPLQPGDRFVVGQTTVAYERDVEG